MSKKAYRVVQPQDKSFKDIAERFGLGVEPVLKANDATDAAAQPPDGKDIWLDFPDDHPENGYQYGTELNSSPKALKYEQIIADPYGGLYRVYLLEVAGKWPRNARVVRPKDFHALWNLYENREFREWQVRNGGRADLMKHPGQCTTFPRSPPPLFYVPKPKPSALVPETPKAVKPDPSNGTAPNTVTLTPDQGMQWEISDEDYPEEPKPLSLDDLVSRVEKTREAGSRAASIEERAVLQAVLAGYETMLQERVALFDVALLAGLPGIRSDLVAELCKPDPNPPPNAIEPFLGPPTSPLCPDRTRRLDDLVIEGIGGTWKQARRITAKISNHTSASAFSCGVWTPHEVIIGTYFPNGATETPDPAIESEGLGLIDYILAIWSAAGILRALARMAMKAITLRVIASELKINAATVGTRSRFPGAQLVQRIARRFTFGSITITADPSLKAGDGATDIFGNIWYSPHGSLQDQQLAIAHEKVHSWLSPKFGPLRELRGNIGQFFYNNSALMCYLEEALAETIAQMKVVGVGPRSFFKGITFPVRNGYITLRRLAGDSLIAVTVLGVKYYVTHTPAPTADREGDK